MTLPSTDFNGVSSMAPPMCPCGKRRHSFVFHLILLVVNLRTATIWVHNGYQGMHICIHIHVSHVFLCVYIYIYTFISLLIYSPTYYIQVLLTYHIIKHITNRRLVNITKYHVFKYWYHQTCCDLSILCLCTTNGSRFLWSPSSLSFIPVASTATRVTSPRFKESDLGRLVAVNLG